MHFLQLCCSFPHFYCTLIKCKECSEQDTDRVQCQSNAGIPDNQRVIKLQNASVRRRKPASRRSQCSKHLQGCAHDTSMSNSQYWKGERSGLLQKGMYVKESGSTQCRTSLYF